MSRLELTGPGVDSAFAASMHRFYARLSVLLLTVSALFWLLSSVPLTRSGPAVLIDPGERVRLNHDNAVTLMLLPGVGDVLAQRIIDDRGASGPYRSLDDVLRVHGMGRKTLERLEPWLSLE